MRHLRLGCALAAFALPMAGLHAQETTATLRGTVVNDTDAPVADASVTIVNVPSGTRSTTTTDATGGFSASGLRIGGPYKVTIAAPGFDSAETTIERLESAAPQRVAVTLFPAGQTITVTASTKSSIALTSGPSITLSQDDIAGIASVSRDVRDLVRRSPYAQFDPTNRSISIAGQNPRFNKFSVDGVQFSDDFGINQGGLPTARGPVPLDAICEFNVQIAPTDVTEGDFQGGAINTVLCSGTNEYHGSAFYTYSDDSLTGDKTRGVKTPLDFKSKNYGFQLRGPIIKDKLFIAVTGERLREGRPADFGPQGEGFGNPIPGLTRGIIDSIKNTASTKYGYDTLDVPSSVTEKDDKLVAKLDWNINDDHRLSATYIYNDSSNFSDSNSASSISPTTPQLSLQSNSYELTEKVQSGVIQLNSQWSDEFSTEARVSYRDYKRGQVPYNGRTFGQFTVCTNPTSDSTSPPAGNGGGLTGCNTGVPRVNFGPDASRQANSLATTNFDVQLQAQLNRNGHNVKAIFQRTRIHVNNLFAQNVSGVFYFDSIADYEAGRANQLVLNVPINGDIDSVAAIFSYNNYTFGIQDTWDVSDTFTFQYGVRYDLYDQSDRPPANQNFFDRQGYSNTANLNGRQLISPRLSANWRPTDRLRFTASAGRFGGGTPDVYVSNSFSNTGVVSNQLTIARTATGADTFTSGIPTAIGQAALNNVTGGEGIPASVIQYLQTNTGSVPRATVNALDPDFKIPSVWRYAVSANYNADLGFLGDDWRLGLDLVYSTVSNGFQVTDARARVVGTLPDGRPRYGQLLGGSTDNNPDYILFNSRSGRSKIAVLRLDKEWDFGLSAGGSYTYNDTTAKSELTSSTSGSLYNQTAAFDPNFSAYGTSNDQIRNQWKFNVGYRHEFIKNAETRLDIFGEIRDGRQFSFTAEDVGSSTRSALYGVLGDDRRFLMYVPTGPNDPLVQYAASGTGANAQTAAQTQAALEDFINNSKLKKYRGGVAPKNLGRSPVNYKLDLRLSQEVPMPLGLKLKLFGDVENFLNLLDSDWGSLRQVGFPYFAPVVQASCASFSGGNCTKYQYTNFQSPVKTLNTRQSLYQIRVGARLEF